MYVAARSAVDASSRRIWPSAAGLTRQAVKHTAGPFHGTGVRCLGARSRQGEHSAAHQNTAAAQQAAFKGPRAAAASSRLRQHKRQQRDQHEAEEFEEDIPSHSRLHARAIIYDDEYHGNQLVAREALTWRREGVQSEHMLQDTHLHGSHDSSDAEGKWWTAWEPDMDEGWDWEEKWHPGPGQALVPRDNPRRPKGPLIQVHRDGHYKPIATLNHTEVARAIITAVEDQWEEVMWQALCRRAEIVAVSMTAAEVCAVVRHASQRQVGQLRLFWKLAGLVVEKLPAFTAKDLVELAKAYSSLDAIHHGLLNVTALTLADKEDERNLTPELAVDFLAAFARARHPLQLALDTSKKTLLSHLQPAADVADGALRPLELEPAAALSALASFAQLGGLDPILLSALVRPALGLSTTPEGASHATSRLGEACAACRWALDAWEPLHRPPRLELNEDQDDFVDNMSQNLTSQMDNVGVDMCGEDAVSLVLETTRDALMSHELKHLRVVAGPDAAQPQCIVPFSSTAYGSHQVSSGTLVRGADILGAAELLVDLKSLSSERRNSRDLALASDLLTGTTRAGQAEAWPEELQVRWLVVASSVAGVVDTNVPVPLLKALRKRPAHRLVPFAPEVFCSLPALTDSGAIGAALDLASFLVPEVRTNLFRLTLRESCRAIGGCLQLVERLPQGDRSALRSEAAQLLAVAVENLPVKFRSECVFQRKHQEGSDPADVVSWCELLADAPLLAAVEGAGGPSEEKIEVAWRHLATEASQVLAAGELDTCGSTLLKLFTAVGRRQHWSALDTESPLGIVAAAVGREWERNVAQDGELEDPIHEPVPLPEAAQQDLRRLFGELGLQPPAAAL